MMNISIKRILSFTISRTFLIDSIALGFILLMPALSHVIGIPLYFIEPMRIMLVIALILTSRYNAYIIAMVLPLFSFLVSGHPAPVKMLIIMSELILNVWLFIAFYKKTHNPFISMFTSVLLSKIFCYFMYWIVFSWAFVVDESQPIFLLMQLVVTMVLSAVVSIPALKRSISAMG